MRNESLMTVAAGSVCWREQTAGIEILIVHRRLHNDISLPKGKRDALETLPQTAKREVREETGIDIDLGSYIGEANYFLKDGSPKTVHYWGSRVTSNQIDKSEFRPNEEIVALEWVNIEHVCDRLSYELDCYIVEKFREILNEGKARTFPIIFWRHAEAEPQSQATANDRDRPLTKRGTADVKNTAPGILAFSPSQIFSSPSLRCRDSAQTLSEVGGLRLDRVDALGQEFLIKESDVAHELLRRQISRKSPSVICSHAPIFFQLVETISPFAGSEYDAVRKSVHLSEGSFSVIHFSSSKKTTLITSVESHEPPSS